VGAGEHLGFGDLLRRHRNAAGLTQEDLAERAGLNPDTISLLERGERRRPHRYTMQSLAEPLGCRNGTAAVSRRQRMPAVSADAHGVQLPSLPLQPTPFIGREKWRR
jgi:transcriptional regulator with XRE-family HTH domain